MTFIRDEEIAAMLAGTPSLAPRVDAQSFRGSKSAIQACSLDLTIGEIFVPEVDEDKLGSSANPLKELSLSQGATAVIRTWESVSLPDDVGGIAFPPANVSVNGLLVTNPGHVDPGYSGSLHLTVINMGRKPFHLKKGERIARLLLFRLDQAPKQSYRQRRTETGSPVITDELLSRLSSDFVDVTARADASADKRIRTAQLGIAIWVPLLAAITGSLLTMAVNKFTGVELQDMNKKIDVVAAKVDALGGHVDLEGIQKQIDDIKGRIK
jgi:dCTP deaminase